MDEIKSVSSITRFCFNCLCYGFFFTVAHLSQLIRLNCELEEFSGGICAAVGDDMSIEKVTIAG